MDEMAFQIIKDRSSTAKVDQQHATSLYSTPSRKQKHLSTPPTREVRSRFTYGHEARLRMDSNRVLEGGPSSLSWPSIGSPSETKRILIPPPVGNHLHPLALFSEKEVSPVLGGIQRAIITPQNRELGKNAPILPSLDDISISVHHPVILKKKKAYASRAQLLSSIECSSSCCCY